MNDLRYAGLSHKEGSLFIILDYLCSYTSKTRHFTLEKMCEEINEIYGLKLVRNTLTSKLEQLEKIGYVVDKKNNYVLEEKEFKDIELRALIDGLVYTNSLSKDSAEELIDKLLYFANDDMRREGKLIKSRMNSFSNKHGYDLLGTYEEAYDAISRRVKVTLNVRQYNSELKMVKKYPKSVCASPYDIVISNNRYILICAIDGEDKLSNLYLDRLTNLSAVDERIRPIEQIPGFEKHGALKEYITSSPDLSGGIPMTFTVKCDNEVLTDFIENLGADFRKYGASKENDDYNTVIKVYTTPQALKLAMLPFLDMVTVIGNKQFNKELTDMFERTKHNIRFAQSPDKVKMFIGNNTEQFRLISKNHYAKCHLKNLSHDDLEQLSKFSFIKKLIIQYSDLRDCRFLKGLDDLELLNLIDCRYDYEYLFEQKNIKTLALTGLPDDKVEGLCKMDSLVDLALFAHNRRMNKNDIYSTVDLIKGLDFLEYLELSGYSFDTDLEFFKKFKGLKRLTVVDCKITKEQESTLKELMPRCDIRVI